MSGQEITPSDKVATGELQKIFEISEILWEQKVAFERLHDLILSQREVRRINPEVFTGIQRELVLLRRLWRDHYLTVDQSINNGILPWSEHRVSSEDFFYALMTDEGPFIRLNRHDLYDGDAEVLSLEISSFGGSASISSELLERCQWFKRVRHTFATSSMLGDKIHTLHLLFEETLVTQDRPEDCMYGRDSLFVEGERESVPLAKLKSPDKYYCPSVKKSFRLMAERLPASVSLEGPTFLGIGKTSAGS
jgi:hypothetical protein